MFGFDKPSLPQNSTDPVKRKTEIARARKKFTYTYEYPAGIAIAAHVPKDEGFSTKFIGKFINSVTDLAINQAEVQISEFDEDVYKSGSMWTRIKHWSQEAIRENFFQSAKTAAETTPDRPGTTIEEYTKFYATIPDSPMLISIEGDDETQDTAFAYQRLAGVNPMMIEGVSALPDDFPVTEAHFAVAMPAGDTLAAALADGRVYMCDYKICADLELGKAGDLQKYAYAPYALFALTQDHTDFRPVAIQIDRGAGPDNPIFTPADHWHWKMARHFVQIADANAHEAGQHLGLTHFVIEACLLSARRNLAEAHPVRVLLEPHFEGTMAINDRSVNSLIWPGGLVDIIMGYTIDSTIQIAARYLSEFSLQDSAPPKDFAARRVDNPALKYPYRDDALLSWSAIEDWVHDYLRLYYHSDKVIADDWELQAFVASLGARDGGRLANIREVKSFDGLVELVSCIIFRASVQHAALNYPQFNMMGLIPNMPGASFQPRHTFDTDVNEEHFVASLPSLSITAAAFAVVYQLSFIRDSRLGRYHVFHFHDSRVKLLLKRLQQTLKEAEATIIARNETRLVPYHYLQPSLIPQSIHI